MIRVGTLIIIYMLFGIWSCTSVRVSSDYDEEVDFSQYTTFGWIEKSGDDDTSQSLLDKRINTAIETAFIEKGYKKTTNGVPDFLVDFVTSVNEKIDLPPRRLGTGEGMGRGRNQAIQTYTEGTLIVDIIDPELEQVIWRGWAISVVDEYDESEETVRSFVESLLKQFPPQ